MKTRLAEIIASLVNRTKSQDDSPEDIRSRQDPRPLDPETNSEGSYETESGRIEVNAPDNRSSELEITRELEEAFARIEAGASFLFLTGRAGTGKSTFIGLLRERLNSYAIVAPTGIAALNVGGQTIHSFFRFPPGPIDFSQIREVRNKIAYKALKTLIIDEISMVRADLLDAIDKFLRKNGRLPDTAFGGVQVIVVGDLFQLPPIIDNEEESAFILHGYKSPFFFSANCLQGYRYETIELTKIFRQSDETFITLLNSIREGIKLERALSAINERLSSLPHQDFEGIILTATNNQASRINAERLAAISSEAKQFSGRILGEFRVDKNKLPAPFELQLKVSAQVMFLKNDPQRRWVNGTLGTVLEISDDNIKVGLNDRWGYRKVTVERTNWDNLKYDYDPERHEVRAQKIGSFEQFPLTLAWAVTVHKSQGKTFDRVHIDLGRGAFAEGQVYVALSRCRTLSGVSVERPLQKSDITLNFEVIEFYRNLKASHL